MESDETDFLKNTISISVKVLPESFFGKKDRKNQRNQLRKGDDQTHIADRIIAFSYYKKHWDDGRYDQNPAKGTPDFPKIVMGKFPRIFIFHRHGSAVAKSGIDFFWCTSGKKSAKADHQEWNQQNRYTHKNPKSHKNSPLESQKIFDVLRLI